MSFLIRNPPTTAEARKRRLQAALYHARQRRLVRLAGNGEPVVVEAPEYAAWTNVEFLSSLAMPITDESNNTFGFTTVGTPANDSGEQLFGSIPMLELDGATEMVASDLAKAEYSPQTQDFSAFVYFKTGATVTQDAGVFSYYRNTSTHWGLNTHASSDRLYFTAWTTTNGGGNFNITGDTDLEPNTLYLVGITNDGTTYRIFQGKVSDGVCAVVGSLISASNPSSNNGGARMRIGGSFWTANGNWLLGHFAEAIYVKGEALFTADFDIPTVPWARS